MVLAASGGGNSIFNCYITFSRIIASKAPSSIVDPGNAKAFKDTLIAGKRVSGLYIIDLDNALALINDSPNSGGADLASINFKAL